MTMIDTETKVPTWKEVKRMRGILTAYQGRATDAAVDYWLTPRGSMNRSSVLGRMADMDSACDMIRTGLCSALAFPSLGSAPEQILKHAHNSTAENATWLVLVAKHVRELAEDSWISLRDLEAPPSLVEPAGPLTIVPTGEEELVSKTFGGVELEEYRAPSAP